MNDSDFENLRDGDIVQNKGSGNAYIIVSNDGNTIVAVRSITITNPSEWTLVYKYESVFKTEYK